MGAQRVWFRRRLISTLGPMLVLFVIAGIACAATAIAETDPPLSVEWRLIENFADSRFAAEMALHNEGSKPIDGRWSLYFNSSGKLTAENLPASLQLEHINGDLYCLNSGADAPALGPNGQLTVQLSGSPWAISASDAPSGFYLVQYAVDGSELPPVALPLEIGPFPDASKIRRGGGDQVPVVTAESRFSANAKLSLLPLENLPLIIPTPIAAKKLPGSITVDQETSIVYAPALKSEANWLANVLEQNFGLKLPVRTAKDAGTGSAIRLKLDELTIHATPRRAGDEAYALIISPENGIEIIGTDPAGVFYGLQTLRGLIPLAAYEKTGEPIAVPAIQIADAPRFGYRGLHLDVGRNFQSVEEVKQLLELMAFYKLNRFHFHLTDDEGWRFEVKALPELTAIGGRRGHTRTESNHLIPSYGSGLDPNESYGSGFYTQDEFIGILRFATARHIVVVPEIDVPGHSRAAVKSMAARAARAEDGKKQYLLTEPGDTSKYESVQAWRDNVIDVGRDESYEFVNVVIGELADMYRQADAPLEIVHLGGDEVPRGAWEASPACRDIPTPRTDITRGQQLEIYFLKRASKLVAEIGATPACWDDCIAFTTADTDWPKRPIAYVWNSVWGWGREDVAYRLANAGFDVVLSNATHLYFDLAIEKDPLEPGYYWAGFVDTRAPFEFNPLDIYQGARSNSMGQPLAADQFAASARLTETGKRHILGIQGQLWGENLRSPELLQYKAFPPTIALAERAWAAEPEFARQSDLAVRDAAMAVAWNQFANALGQRELRRLHHIAGRFAYRIPPPGVIHSDGQLHANIAYPGLTIRYTTDGSEPTIDSSVYSAPLPFAPGVRFRAFDPHGHDGRTAIID
jgi:hexosaminidase